MAAYAALVSLSDTIHRLLSHNRLSISLEENQQLLSLLDYVSSFQVFLEKFPDKYNSLEWRMRELAHEAEDIIEYFMLDQVSSWPDDDAKETILGLKQNIDFCFLLPKQMKGYHTFCSEEDEVECAPPIGKDAMVGFENLVIDLKDRLCGEPSKLHVIPICGMAGIGKTTLARNVYDDPSVVDHFVIRVWVTISQYSSVQRTLSSLLECLKEFNTSGLGLGRSDEEKVYQILRGGRYLVVMDSIWSSKAWDVVRKVFPDESNGSRIMITTRSCDVASYPDSSSKIYQMGLLSEDRSWNLLEKKVFGDEDCPSGLENIGKEIARGCKGWPLAIVAVAEFLCTTTSDKDWAEVIELLNSEDGSSFSDVESISHPSRKYQLRLKKVIREIDLVANEVKEIKNISSSNDVECGGAGSLASLSSSSAAPSIHKDAMVGFQDYVLDIKDRLCGEPSRKLKVIPICGMGGIGKTTLARHVYDDPLIMGNFVVRVWVTVSQDFSAERIFSSILESLKEYSKDVEGENDEKVHKVLKWRKYLVVLDDIWSSEAWDVVRRVFPDDGNGSRILLTTRSSDVASYPDASSKLHEMSLLNADQSWELFKQKVFANEDCPSELENIGKEIAKGCKGLPLAIVVIAGLLSTISRNRTSWLEIAENVKSAQTAEIEEILSWSYIHLPQYLRPCFLYMGSFPEDHEIHVKKLTRLWIAEGFIKSPTDSNSFEKVAEECLDELVKRNLVLARKRKWDGKVKSCSLHDLMRELCIRKARESNFFLNVMDTDIEEEHFIENVRNERRISVDSSDLVFLSELNGSNIHSIKSSLHDLRKQDLFESVRLLRVMDAEPFEADYLPSNGHLYELFHLRYLALTFHWFSLSSLKLPNLQTLVIHDRYRYNILLSWCMPQLRHVYVEGQVLFEYPEESTRPLENLQTLSCLSDKYCTERIVKLLPNLKELTIDFSGDHDEGAVWLNNLVHLQQLENLTIIVIYGGSRYYYKNTFPSSLKKLTLNNLKLPWDDIFVVDSFPNLQMLKLEYCTCIGGTWETIEGAFPALEVLLIKRARLENWITESSHFPRLKRLLIHSCEDLNGIPNDIGDIPTLEMIRVTGDAKKSLVESVQLIREEQEDLENTLEVLCNADTC